MVVPESISVRINNTNIDHYRSLGYTINPKDLLQVSTLELPAFSHTYIMCNCEECGDIFKVTKSKYTRSINSYGLYKCKSCSRIYKKLSQETVEQRFTARGYTLIDTYINNKKPLLFICNLHPKLGVQKIALGDLGKGYGCKLCTSSARWDKIKPTKQMTTASYLRITIKPWINSVVKSAYNVIGINFNKESYHIHHLDPPFKDIVKLFFKCYEPLFQYNKFISDYTEKEVEMIATLFNIYHDKMAIGIPLKSDIHLKYHRSRKIQNDDALVDFLIANDANKQVK